MTNTRKVKRSKGLTAREAQRAFKLLKEARAQALLDVDQGRWAGAGGNVELDMKAKLCQRIGKFLRKHGAEEPRKAWADKEDGGG